MSAFANVGNLNLAAGNVAHTEGRIETDQYLRSRSNTAVHVCGDAARSTPQLSPIATYEGRIVGRNIVEGPQYRPDYSSVPSAVFTVPAVASVGLTEAGAKERGHAVQVHVNDMRQWLSARSYAETVAWSKIVVDGDSDRLIGAHIVGHGGEEVIHTFALAMRHGIADGIYAFPTFSGDSKHVM